MPDSSSQAFDIARTIIGLVEVVPNDILADAITRACSITPGADPEKVRNKLLAYYTTPIDDYTILEGKDKQKPWLMQFKSMGQSEWTFWKRYKTYLDVKKGFPRPILANVDKLSDDILDHLFNPQIKNVEITKKGLVVGQVQSGKTANYTAVICKAVDAGFNFIIVLAGMHNNLRSQTQNRLDTDFLGFDTHFGRKFEEGHSTKIGVGLFPEYKDAIAHSITTSEEKGDFTRRGADSLGINFDTPTPILVVVKKNGSVLTRLNNWLQTYAAHGKIRNKAVLIIDDEADNASINTKEKGKPASAINNHILSCMEKFARVAYVGYTATPYANIFIPLDTHERKDLFPNDFIINLKAPDNYIGPEKVFGTYTDPEKANEHVLPIVTTIDDYKEFVPTKHRKANPLPSFNQIPESLKTAIKSFIITCAIRIARGQDTVHNSMLIHVTRYQNWQNTIKEYVERLFRFYKQEIEADDSQMMEEFRQILEEDTPTYKSYKTVSAEILDSEFKDLDKEVQIHSWDEIRPLLFRAVQKIEVRSINGSSADALSYYDHKDTGLSVIAIGGDKLSRGLTLEGLSVSYFLRASKMYDTLMQMGRWFGYRGGYVDLCRLYISQELKDWFKHITIASEELREEFDYLYDTGGTPEHYRLKVMSHPGVLQITAVTKMRYTDTIKVSWASRLVETYQLQLNPIVRSDNLLYTDNFLSSLGQPERPEKGPENYLWRDVSPDLVVDYLNQFRVGEQLKKVNLDLICKYIEKLNETGELTSWSVGLMSRTPNDEGSDYTFSNGIKVYNFLRNNADETSKDTYFIRKNHIVGGREDEFIDLDDAVLSAALEETKRLKAQKHKEWKSDFPSPVVVRDKFRPHSTALLMIYPLNPAGANKDMYKASDAPFIGLVIAFPNTDREDVKCDYKSNLVPEFEQDEIEFENDNDNTYAND